ncbi:CotS family spore coat protein [Natranaerovirga pectinivora]|uniref:CotS family spore coat protein n=1 Tax=Natranaerovirga pectinivora TaxID=682400 RepID=A0A4R3MK49_9FIRM|nr:CotS family spore coat protein [Natranaerovirga pectinivora]TCT13946.1 CotS family spore coat protein [Natranaerovirga pectinivora]
MIENINKIVENYGFKVKNYYRGRGAHICETNKGVKLLKEMETTVNRTWFEFYVKKHLIEKGFTDVDQFNLVEDKPFYELNDKKYILKDWCTGRECNLYDEKETIQAVENLAKIHKGLQNVSFPEHSVVYSNLGDLTYNLKRHTNELKKVRKYIRNKSHWSEFDILFLKNYSYYYSKAKESINGFEVSDYNSLVKDAQSKGQVCHGQYTQHNVLLTNSSTMTVNFEKSCLDLQIMDLYHFIRKVMEKNNWNANYGMKMIEAYNKVNSLDQDGLEILYFTLLYPEKFWKIANYYFNTRKAWEPKLSLEKLQKIITQKETKHEFLSMLEKSCK